MEVTGVWGVSLSALQRAVRTAEPAALLVPGRILRRVIKRDSGIPGPGLTVPHRKTYVVDRAVLLASADRLELGLANHEALPERLLLLAEPEPEKLALMTRPRALFKYWRLLFHASVDAALAAAVNDGRLDFDEVRRRRAELGPVVWAEVEAVLARDEWLLAPDNDVAAYCEFLAVFAELSFFAPRLLPDYFPSLCGAESVDRLTVDQQLARDLNVAMLFERTRLAGAPLPEELAASNDDEAIPDPTDDAPVPRAERSERRYCKLMDRADHARAAGNSVRAAVFGLRASATIGPHLAKIARGQAESDVCQLASRLRRALELDEEAEHAWAGALVDLLAAVGTGLWAVEGRLLYDLQKVCVDAERGVFALDLLRWAVSLGRVPMRRPLPNQREVLMVQHLRAARDRLQAARIGPDLRGRLTELLATAIDQSTDRMRGTLRPRIEQAFDEVGLCPSNVPERVARRKLIEELLDGVARRGFLTMGDVRDSVARNQMKIADLQSTDDLRHGDQLLRADRRLNELLDGVYHGGEVYLRFPQRLSSLAFGTQRGRFLTRNLFVPFGAAFLGIEFFGHLAHSIAGWVSGPETMSAETTSPGLANLLLNVAVGSLLWVLMHCPGFRQQLWQAATTFWSWLRTVFVEWPQQWLQLPWVRDLLTSQLARWFERFALKPIIFTSATLAVLGLLSRESSTWAGRAALFIAMNLLLNSRIGRDVDEVVTDLLVRGWRQFRVRIIAASFQLIAETFSHLLEQLERFLYSVDEWLRFRRDESRLATMGKAVLGVVWACVTYVLRFCVTLLIEPQINPLKHFPVVTVSHKIILPLAFTKDVVRVPSTLASILLGIGSLTIEEANFIAGSVVWGIPGIFGFLVWELKENWRIFAANRAEQLQPIVLGSHGETLRRLLHPGFHSGTIPKLFARLRREDRRASFTGRWLSAHEQHDRLAHIAEAIGHAVEREVVVLLEESQAWPVGQLTLQQVRLGVGHVRIELQVNPAGAAEMSVAAQIVLTVGIQQGWLVGSLDLPNALLSLPPEQVVALQTAVRGWFQLCGVELYTGDIVAAIAPPAVDYQITTRGFVVWLDDQRHLEAAYDLRSGAEEVFPVGSAEACRRLRPILGGELDFTRQAFTWQQWLALWNPGVDRAVAKQPLDPTSLVVG